MEELLESDAIEVTAPADEQADEARVRPLPATVDAAAEVSAWKGEARTAAIAAAGGLVAGAATVAHRACHARRIFEEARAQVALEGPSGEGPRQPLLHRRRPPDRPLVPCAAKGSDRSTSRCGRRGRTGYAAGSARTGPRAGVGLS